MQFKLATMMLAALALTAPLAAAAPAPGGAIPDAPAYAGKGDWRRHEIVRVWRDEDGCRLSVISYHRPDGGVDTREDRDCGK